MGHYNINLIQKNIKKYGYSLELKKGGDYSLIKGEEEVLTVPTSDGNVLEFTIDNIATYISKEEKEKKPNIYRDLIEKERKRPIKRKPRYNLEHRLENTFSIMLIATSVASLLWMASKERLITGFVALENISTPTYDIGIIISIIVILGLLICKFKLKRTKK